ncbi:MAG: hypothetical protein O2958_10750 [Gemmatimonadetes bacterium]|nr:hypothetical protein [Gemmatimonadota bacterium]MDA1103409.1 hypothetical protein [Gemmatimonadota bacterium]
MMRAALALGLLVLLVVGPRLGGDETEPLAVDGSTTEVSLAQALATGPFDRPTVYSASTPPSGVTQALLAGAAESGRRVEVIVPGALPALTVSRLGPLVARRRASLYVTVRGTAGARIPLVVDDASGATDTVTVEVGPSGVTTNAIAVEPTRAGANEWTVHAGGASVVAQGWARPEAPLRILMLSGPPTWEGRYLLRALEAAGSDVTVRQELGRERSITTRGAPATASASALEGYDVLVVLGPVAASSEASIERWVAERGGGLLLVGSIAGRRASAARTPSSAPVRADASRLRWSGPAELIPLPSSDLTVDAAALPVPRSGQRVTSAPTLTDGTDDVYTTVEWVGRGRIFTTGMETWPWAMEAGLGEAHRLYWESVTEWLGGGLRSDTHLVGPTVHVGTVWTGRVEGMMPATFELVGPDRKETLRPVRTSDGAHLVRFLPTEAGGYALGADLHFGAPVTTGHEGGSWVEAALEIGGAGGTVRVASAAGDRGGRPLGSPTPLPWIAFATLAALAGASWARRRIRGLP